MNRNLQPLNKIEKTLEENPFLTILESAVIFKTYNDKIRISLNQISNVKIIKSRDTTPNFILLVFTAVFMLLSKSIFQKLNFINESLYIIFISILLVVTFSIKNFTYKLLINRGKIGFNEIRISKSNVFYAEKFVNKFENTNTLKVNKQESNFKFKDFEVYANS